MGQTSAVEQITSAVQKLYEAFPYPKYPLFGKPIWQDGYLTSSKFAATLLEELHGGEAAINHARGQFVRQGRTVLVAGSGEILPYIIRKNEPSAHRLLCVDLSRRSLRRAQFRLLGNFRPTDFIRSDINQFLSQQGSVTGPYDHIDVYGVLHHLPNPRQTLQLMANHLSGNGTMRVMVYNTEARYWIHHLQSVFRLLKLNLHKNADLLVARNLITRLGEASPHLAHKLKCLGQGTLKNDARFIDTFFHVREAKLPIKSWFHMFESLGLKPLALVDRYGELDDLDNPMWKVPDAAILQARSETGEFENNLELYLYKPAKKVSATTKYTYERKPNRMDVWSYYFKSPPHNWFTFSETNAIPRRMRFRLWVQHFSSTFKTIAPKNRKTFESNLPLKALQRLARIGAIFPSQIGDKKILKAISGPMEQRSDVQPQRFDKANFTRHEVAAFIRQELTARGIMSERRLHLILERLNRSQMPR